MIGRKMRAGVMRYRLLKLLEVAGEEGADVNTILAYMSDCIRSCVLREIRNCVVLGLIKVDFFGRYRLTEKGLEFCKQEN
jgi:predicted transcriptional regulator